MKMWRYTNTHKMNYYSVTKKEILSFATVWMDPPGVRYGTGNKSDREGQILHDLNCHCCSVTQSCLNLCDPMDYSMPGFPVHHQLLELAQTHLHQVGDTIQLFHSLLSPSPPALNPSQHQDLFQWVSSSHQVAKVLELQLQHQFFHKYSGLISFRIY